MQQKPILGIIGGSGLYEFPDLENFEQLNIDTPFGKPSAPIIAGTLHGKKIVFLARHGIGHHIVPSEIPFRANIYALKSLGVERIISISASGSLREDYAPGEMVVPDQLFDFTRNRKRTFFGDGLAAHISVADPFCVDLSSNIYDAVVNSGAKVHRGGTYITIEGPRFSTKSESHTFRAWGMSIIGMTTAPEAFLAKEAEICYAVMSHITDYDSWHIGEKPVTVEMVIETLNLSRNTEIAQNAIKQLVHELKPERNNCDCSQALSNAFITSPDRIPQETRQKLSLLVDKYLP